MGPVQEVLTVQYEFHAADAALKRVNRLTLLHQEPAYPHRFDPFAHKSTVGVELEDVRFAYGDGPNVLDGVSFSIDRGEKLAIVGASGSGKTTLVQVILGLYPPTAGCVRFDGKPVEQIGMDVVRDHVATVLQHPALFNDTVRNNLTLGRELDDERLWNALRIAQLDAVIGKLDQALEARVGRDGVRLSGGQRQRLAIARAILRNPTLLLLDEATSALDAESERAVQEALENLMQGRTGIIIAHRLATVRRVDRILVMDQGRIVAAGTHDTLRAQGGLYARLARLQFRDDPERSAASGRRVVTQS
jgi:ATP-binding cassette subfamily C protein